MKKIKKVYVGFAFRHHLHTHAGYHQIKKYIDYDDFIDCQWERNWVDEIIANKTLFGRFYVRLFGARLWMSEIRCVFYSLIHKNVVFHVIYGENLLKYLHLFLGKRNKIVSTFHLPYDQLKTNKSYLNALRHSDKVVLMSNKDVQPIKALRGDENVYFIPHGIDVQFYNCGTVKREHKLVLMVGNMLRDFKFANNLFHRMIAQDPNVRVMVVCHDRHKSKFDLDTPNLQVMSNISNELLLELYQKASILVLPMTSFTANNSLLEAIACGCHVHIFSDVIDDSYQEKDLISYSGLNLDEASQYLHRYFDSFSFDSNKVRETAVRLYSWETIAKRVDEILF